MKISYLFSEDIPNHKTLIESNYYTTQQIDRQRLLLQAILIHYLSYSYFASDFSTYYKRSSVRRFHASFMGNQKTVKDCFYNIVLIFCKRFLNIIPRRLHRAQVACINYKRPSVRTRAADCCAAPLWVWRRYATNFLDCAQHNRDGLGIGCNVVHIMVTK